MNERKALGIQRTIIGQEYKGNDRYNIKDIEYYRQNLANGVLSLLANVEISEYKSKQDKFNSQIMSILDGILPIERD